MLLASWVPAEAAVFPAREPYIQLVTPTSATVVWRTDDTSADDSRVQYGTGTLDQTAFATAITRVTSGEPTVKDHIVKISGLSPATKYFYNVGTVTNGVQGGGTANHFFWTAPTSGPTTTPFSVWLLGDSGAGSLEQTQVRDAMLNFTACNPPSGDCPDLILHAGDIAYESGLNAQFTNNHFKIYENILRNTPSWTTLGNHEGQRANSLTEGGPYFDAHVLPTNAEAGGFASGTEAYYSFDYANTHFIVLNSQELNPTFVAEMIDWLDNDLMTTQDWVIAMWHHPPYSKGTHDSDSSSDSGGRLVNMREDILPILEAGGVDLILAGHSHAYERSYLIDGAYGYFEEPTCFPPGDSACTPSFSKLQADGHILDAGEGDPAGAGPYQKTEGASNDGTVYVVAGHGGRSIGGVGGHPVMLRFDPEFGSAPAITTQPSSVTVTEPAPASFTVVATGTPPLTYQWRRNGTNLVNGGAITGATSATLTLNPTATADSDTYDVVVNNSVGPAVTSAPATLTVNASGGAPVLAWRAGLQNPSGAWTDSSFDNRSFRVLLEGDVISTSGSTVQVTLRGRNSGSSYTMENISLVQRDGATLNGVGPLTPVTFNGGATSVTVPTGTTVLSDPIAFNLVAGQDVFLTFWAPPGAPGVYRTGGGSLMAWTSRERLIGTGYRSVIHGRLSTMCRRYTCCRGHNDLAWGPSQLTSNISPGLLCQRGL
jgi:hypothetical protein